MRVPDFTHRERKSVVADSNPAGKESKLLSSSRLGVHDDDTSRGSRRRNKGDMIKDACWHGTERVSRLSELGRWAAIRNQNEAIGKKRWRGF